MELKDRKWMSWEGGVDLVALTSPDLQQPNVIIHVARIVHTPIGSAPAGMLLYQTNPNGAPDAIGFIGPDARLGAWFGPNIFAGTPFEGAPALEAQIDIDTKQPGSVASIVRAAGHTFEVRMEGLGDLELVQRSPGGMTPFYQQGLEAAASKVTLTVDGAPVSIVVPPIGISGGPAAVFAPCGIYAR